MDITLFEYRAGFDKLMEGLPPIAYSVVSELLDIVMEADERDWLAVRLRYAEDVVPVIRRLIAPDSASPGPASSGPGHTPASETP